MIRRIVDDNYKKEEQEVKVYIANCEFLDNYCCAGAGYLWPQVTLSQGGAIFSGYTMTVEHTIFSSNRAFNNPTHSECIVGGAAVMSEIIHCFNCSVVNNHISYVGTARSSELYGGAIYANEVNLTHSNISSNSIDTKTGGHTAEGGAVYARNLYKSLNCHLNKNRIHQTIPALLQAKILGGAVYCGENSNSTYDVFSNNVLSAQDEVTAEGAAFYSTNVDVMYGIFNENEIYAGTCYGTISGSALNITHSIFVENQIVGNYAFGGAVGVYFENSESLYLDNCSFYFNQVTGFESGAGGAVFHNAWIQDTQTVYVKNSIFELNNVRGFLHFFFLFY